MITTETVFKEAATLVIMKKLTTDNYFYLGNFLQHLNIQILNERLDKYLPSNTFFEADSAEKKEEKYKIKLENIQNDYDNILQFISHDKKSRPLSFLEAEAIMMLYFYKNGTKDKQQNFEKNIQSDLESHGLIKKNTYITQKKKHFILSKDFNFVSIKKLEDYITCCSNDIATTSTTRFYRGHSNVNYLSEPGLYRDNFIACEKKMYNQLKIQCHQEFKECHSKFEEICLMQHYGLPTRLLDISSNPLVALYFACCKEGNGEVIVYEIENKKIQYENSDIVTILSILSDFEFFEQQEICFDLNYIDVTRKNMDFSKSFTSFKEKINKENIVISDFDLKKCVLSFSFVTPIQSNRRIINQKGNFVLFGLQNETYTKDISNFHNLEDNRLKIIYFIANDSKKLILDQLAKNGIDQSFVYPDIEKVAEHIRREMSAKKEEVNLYSAENDFLESDDSDFKTEISDEAFRELIGV